MVKQNVYAMMVVIIIQIAIIVINLGAMRKGKNV